MVEASMPIMQRLQTSLWLRRHWPMILILVAYVFLCLGYSVAVPLGETPDELAHYQYVRYLDLIGRPPLTAAERQQAGYKGHEPPLYYLFVQKVTAYLHVAQHPMLKLIDPDLQPRHSIGAEVMLWDSVLHTEDESFPWQGTSLAWHMLRLPSIPLGMVTILCTYGIVRRLFPARLALALGAAGINALMPQFVFISSVMNNDNLAVPLSVATLWVLVHMVRGDLRWRWFVLLGILIGLARMTKFYTLILVPVMGVSLLLLAWYHHRWRRCLSGGALAAVLLVAISAPWILAVQPDDPALAPQGALGFGLKMLDILHTDRALRSQGVSAAGGGLAALPALASSFFRLEPRRWAELLFKSFWAYFGTMTVEAGRGVYLALAGLVALAVLGTIWLLLRRRRTANASADQGRLRVAIAILAIQACAFVFVEATFYTLMRRLPDTAQGRHIYPAMPAWMAFLAVGLLGWMPRLAGYRAVGALSLGFAALTIYCLPTYVLAAYEPAYPVRTALVSSWRPAVDRYQEAAPGIRSLGYSPAVVQAAAGEAVQMTLLWQATSPIAPEYLLRISYVDGKGVERTLNLAQPAEGRWPTRAWDPGDYICDEYRFTIPQGLPAGEYTLHAQWVGHDLAPVGVPLEAGLLQLAEEQRSPDQRAKGTTATEAMRLKGAGDTAHYRQTIAVTTAALQGQISPTLRFMSQGHEWLPLATQSYPADDGMTLWRSFFMVTGHTLPGRYELVADEGAKEQGNNPALTVETRSRRFAMSDGYTAVNAVFGAQIVLEGYRLGGVSWSDTPHPALGSRYPTMKPGQTLSLRLAWQASTWIEQNYTVFTHLLDEQNAIRAQDDRIPRLDEATLFWVPGEVVQDSYHLALPPDAPAGVYWLEVGLYSRGDDARLPTNGATGQTDSRVMLSPILVKEP